MASTERLSTHPVPSAKGIPTPSPTLRVAELPTMVRVTLTVPARVTSNDRVDAPPMARLLANVTVVVVGVGSGVVGGSSSHPARVSEEASTSAANVVLRTNAGFMAEVSLSRKSGMPDPHGKVYGTRQVPGVEDGRAVGARVQGHRQLSRQARRCGLGRRSRAPRAAGNPDANAKGRGQCRASRCLDGGQRQCDGTSLGHGE